MVGAARRLATELVVIIASATQEIHCAAGTGVRAGTASAGGGSGASPARPSPAGLPFPAGVDPTGTAVPPGAAGAARCRGAGSPVVGAVSADMVPPFSAPSPATGITLGRRRNGRPHPAGVTRP